MAGGKKFDSAEIGEESESGEAGEVTDILPEVIPANETEIRSLIYTVRGAQVMLDSDLATLYGVETRALNQAVARHPDRFPERFCFRLTREEEAILKSQSVISNEERWGGRSGVEVTVWTHPRTSLTQLDVDAFNVQHPQLAVRHTVAFHDRFLILDGAEGYFVGASLKDAGSKSFAITAIEDNDTIASILGRLEN